MVGAPGTYPTNWLFSTLATGVTREMVGNGIEDGIPYVDIRVSGTPSTALMHLLTDTTTGIPAVSGQQWGTSVYCSLVAGSTANWVFFSLLGYFTSSTGTVLVNAGSTTDAASFPTSAPLRMQRYVNTTIPTNDSIACTAGVGIRIQVATGSPIDFTLRIGAPQAELLTSSPANFVAPVGGSWVASNAVATNFQTDIVGTSHAVFVTDNAVSTTHTYQGTLVRFRPISRILARSTSRMVAVAICGTRYTTPAVPAIRST